MLCMCGCGKEAGKTKTKLPKKFFSRACHKKYHFDRNPIQAFNSELEDYQSTDEATLNLAIEGDERAVTALKDLGVVSIQRDGKRVVIGEGLGGVLLGTLNKR